MYTLHAIHTPLNLIGISHLIRELTPGQYMSIFISLMKMQMNASLKRFLLLRLLPLAFFHVH